MLDLKLDRTGTLTITKDQIEVSGFSADNAMCREVAALACLWGIKVLQKELEDTIAKAGGGISVICDEPDDDENY